MRRTSNSRRGGASDLCSRILGSRSRFNMPPEQVLHEKTPNVSIIENRAEADPVEEDVMLFSIAAAFFPMSSCSDLVASDFIQRHLDRKDRPGVEEWPYCPDYLLR